MADEQKRGRGRPKNPIPVPPSSGDRAAWENATARKMEEIIGKLMAKLEQKMDSIKAEKIPLAVAILTDKAALLSGRPTSMSATLTLKGNFNPEEIKARLTGKADKTIKAVATRNVLVETESQESVSPPLKDRQHLPSALATLDPAEPYAEIESIDTQSSEPQSQTTEDEQR